MLALSTMHVITKERLKIAKIMKGGLEGTHCAVLFSLTSEGQRVLSIFRHSFILKVMWWGTL